MNEFFGLEAAMEDYLEGVLRYIREGGNVRFKDENYTTALHHAATSTHPEMVDALVAAGALVDGRDIAGATPLLYAAGRDGAAHAGSVRRLIAAGASLDLPDDRGVTPLMQAVCWENLDMVKLLVEAGADTGARDRSGRTALEMAKANRHQEIIEYLEPPHPDVKLAD